MAPINMFKAAAEGLIIELTNISINGNIETKLG